MTLRTRLLCLPLLFVVAPALALAAEAKPLLLATVPVQKPKVQKDVFDLLRGELARRLKQPVEFVRLASYDEAIKALNDKKVDLAMIGAAAYVTAQQQSGAKALLRAVRNGKTDYRGALIVRDDSKIQKLGDLKGKKVAFVDRYSTTGYLYARRLLANAGLKEGADYQPLFVGGHEQVVTAVQKGEAQAGACFEGAESEIDDFVNPTKMRVLGYTVPVPADVMVVRAGLDPKLTKALSEALQKLPEMPEGDLFLLFMAMDKFVPINEADYAGVAEVLKEGK